MPAPYHPTPSARRENVVSAATASDAGGEWREELIASAMANFNATRRAAEEMADAVQRSGRLPVRPDTRDTRRQSRVTARPVEHRSGAGFSNTETPREHAAEPVGAARGGAIRRP